MGWIEYATDTVIFKILYAGPSGCGKTTNLRQLSKLLAKDTTVDSLPAPGEPTLFFDLLPVSLKRTQGMNVRFHLLTLPGHRFFPKLAKALVKQADGLVFVVDSDPQKMRLNLECLLSVYDLLESVGISRAEIPTVIQFNKRDLEFSESARELVSTFVPSHGTWNEATAIKGEGCLETLRLIADRIMPRWPLQPQSTKSME